MAQMTHSYQFSIAKSCSSTQFERRCRPQWLKICVKSLIWDMRAKRKEFSNLRKLLALLTQKCTKWDIFEWFSNNVFFRYQTIADSIKTGKSAIATQVLRHYDEVPRVRSCWRDAYTPTHFLLTIDMTPTFCSIIHSQTQKQRFF